MELFEDCSCEVDEFGGRDGSRSAACVARLANDWRLAELLVGSSMGGGFEAGTLGVLELRVAPKLAPGPIGSEV